MRNPSSLQKRTRYALGGYDCLLDAVVVVVAVEASAPRAQLLQKKLPVYLTLASDKAPAAARNCWGYLPICVNTPTWT